MNSSSQSFFTKCLQVRKIAAKTVDIRIANLNGYEYPALNLTLFIASYRLQRPSFDSVG